jgi:hypothetical protein
VPPIAVAAVPGRSATADALGTVKADNALRTLSAQQSLALQQYTLSARPKFAIRRRVHAGQLRASTASHAF